MTQLQLTGMDEITTLLNSRRQAVLVNTFEEERFQQDLQPIADLKGYEMIGWTITSGFIDLKTNEVISNIPDPQKAIKFIEDYKNSAIFILKDIHDLWTNYMVKRKIRDFLEFPKTGAYKPLFFVSPEINIPSELEKLVTLVTYELPERKEVEEQLAGMETFLKDNNLPLPEGRERQAILNALIGMTLSEVTNVLKKTVAKNKKIDLNDIVAEKEQIIKKTGLLEYITQLGDMKNVGGLDLLKDWFNDAQYAFDFDAKEFNVDPIRGVVLAGFPGTGKSMVSKSIAYQWNLPLLKMNMSDIMDSKVGQSEKNIDRALKLAEAISPCVLWIDEFEKALAGMGSSDKSDGGTTSRVVSSLLTWLSDKQKPVFMIATANDITKLPAELTRAGRFDEIFFMSVPSLAERIDILSIHLSKRGYTVLGDLDKNSIDTDRSIVFRKDLESIAEEMDDFTGAEIEQVVSESGRRAYAAFRKGERETHYMTLDDLQLQSTKLIPLAKRNPSLLSDLRDWAKQSAKCASSTEHQLMHGAPEKPVLFDVGSPSDFAIDIQ